MTKYIKCSNLFYIKQTTNTLRVYKKKGTLYYYTYLKKRSPQYTTLECLIRCAGYTHPNENYVVKYFI